MHVIRVIRVFRGSSSGRIGFVLRHRQEYPASLSQQDVPQLVTSPHN